MDIAKLDKANELVESVRVIEKIEQAFSKNNWVKISTPDYKDGLDIPNVLWSDLRDFLKEKADEYEKIFTEL